MCDSKAPAGEVLVRAQVTEDGRTVLIAPGVELPIGSVLIEAELPRRTGAEAFGLLVFTTPEDRQDIADVWADVGVETRDIDL